LARAIAGHDNLVTFVNSQALAGQGTLVHLTRNLVVFEVYNPYSIVQLSEVLRELRVLRGERVIYSGRAVVSNLVSTGLMVIASATLVDSWQDLEGIKPGPELRAEVTGFVKDWDASNALRPGYQLAVSRLRAFLGELSRWLDQVDAATGTADRDAAQAIQREVTLEVEAALAGKLVDLFGAFETEASQVPPAEAPSHQAFARREVHPLTLASPFVHRTFTKPLGYAGDYEMVNMIVRDPLDGPNTYARVVNASVLRRDNAEGHRNRIDRLVEILQAEARRSARAAEVGTGGDKGPGGDGGGAGLGGRPLRVLNVGCGPAQEVQRFVRDDALAGRCELHLLDFNTETLEYARRQITAAADAGGHCPTLEFHHKSVNELLRDATRHAQGKEGGGGGAAAPYVGADLIYCAGLFDYLTDKVCGRLLQLFHAWVAPGGLVVATNVHPRNRTRYFMEHLLDWHLIYRDEAQMRALTPPAAADPRVYAEAVGVNVFLEFRKAAGGAEN
jgi:extracellular factor (EF) 3-hydroxypalmitic acid methyl ester biosynthesis protein